MSQTKRSWKVSGVWPIYEDFEILKTVVQIISDDGKSFISETLVGDQTKLGHEELILSVIDIFVKREKTDVMISDAVLKVDELDQALIETRKSLKDLKEFKEVMVQFMDNAKSDITSIASSQTDKFNELKDQFDIINNSFMELLAQTFGGDSDDTEYSEPDGSVPVSGDETVPVADGEVEAVAD